MRVVKLVRFLFQVFISGTGEPQRSGGESGARAAARS